MSEEGERCPCTSRLEMDHLEPAKETGRSGVDDLTTRCRPHNQWRAYVRYGAEFMGRRIAESRLERAVQAG